MSGPCQLHLDMSLMESYENELEDLRKDLDTYRTIFRHIAAEATGAFFICGEAGERTNGLPEYISICPAYGADVRATVLYKRYNKP